ncbi:putative AAA+ ATPase domain, CDR ABC transporter, ABC transporter, G1 [Plasmopara halstedii]
MTLLDEKKPGLESGSALMANGPQVLHDHVASTFKASLRRPLPQIEVRFKNLSISTDIAVTEENRDKYELPTLWHAFKKTLTKCSAQQHVVRKEILKNISGVFKPGTLTLVLGQPGSGKSSLMRILSNRFPMDSSITVEGDISFNGDPLAKVSKRLPQLVSYVPQRDIHFPLLTVKETLEFAHETAGRKIIHQGEKRLIHGSSDENLAASNISKALSKHYPDVIIRQLGLTNCQDTIVGDVMHRGVSGGERKRVTTGEMEFGSKTVVFMDEISTGLDSAATFDIISTQRSVATNLNKTVVIALLQPSPEVFELFDDVLILNDGEIIYHGPRGQVDSYFASMGFVRPPGRDVADFVLDLGTKQQRQYEPSVSNGQNEIPRQAAEFAALFRQSHIYQESLRLLDAPLDRVLLNHKAEDMDSVPGFQQSFWESTSTLMRRQFMLTIREKEFLISRIVMTTIMGLINASTFWNVDPTNAQLMLGVLFQSILFLAIGQTSLIPLFMSARSIFYKQRSANFYRTSVYVLSCSVTQLPLAIGESLIFGTLIYWLCGFVNAAGNYIIFMVLLTLTNTAFAAWFFLITAVSPDIHISKPVAMMSIVFFILFAGFVVTKNQLPDYFIWFYWLNPISWCLRALAVNQYRSSTFDVCVYDGFNFCATFDLNAGEYFMSLFEISTDKFWIICGGIFMIVAYIVFMTLSFLVLEYMRYDSPEQASISKKLVENEDSYVALNSPKSVGLQAAQPADSTVLDINNKEKNFVPVTLAFQDLWYSVKSPSNPNESLDLLKGISGFAMPGSITALMGSSGAGKTTLMDVIAGRKTEGTIKGKILLNGYEATDLAIRRSTGYCEQMDIHSEASTFREALTFSSFLRQDSSVPHSRKIDSVNECLDLLDMHDIADHIIRGSSVEQMKRLTIGVELAAQPSVLFLDEPTSGLDARSAKLIMDGVRKVADSGRTIVCTIHQPSTEVFLVFDSLLLLKRGGETVFFGNLGTNCQHLIDYFSSIPGSPELLKGYNPATWMLECIGAGVGKNSSNDVDFVEYFNQSKEKQALVANMNVEGVTSPSSQTKELTFDRKRASSSMTQAKFLLIRFVRMYWRTPTYNITRMIIALMLGLLAGLVFVDANYTSYQELNSGVGMLYLMALFNGLVSFSSVLPIASNDRASFYRERASQTYNALWYFVGSTIAEIPYSFISGALFTAVFYPMVGFEGLGASILFWINLSILMLMMTYMGQLFVYVMPNLEVADVLGLLISSIYILFMGYNPPASEIPSGYRWLYDITPYTYSIGNLVALVFANCDDLPLWDETTQQYVGGDLHSEYVENVFNINHDNLWRNFGIVFAFIFVYRILGLLALRFVNHQKR